MLASEGGASVAVSNLPASANTVAMPIRPVASSGSPRPSTLPRSAPAPPEQAPPRYEDIFPIEPTTMSQDSGYLRTPPPCYSSGGTLTATPQPPHSSKPESLAASGGESLVGDSDYYSPPLDRQQSGEYTSPVTEENIYEEIDKVCICVCMSACALMCIYLTGTYRRGLYLHFSSLTLVSCIVFA